MLDRYLVVNGTSWSEEHGGMKPGGVAEQVWGQLVSELDIPVVRQPVEGAINLYTHGRSHFLRPKAELGVFVNHGISDKGNWAHHRPRFDVTIVPHSWLHGQLADDRGRPVLYGGVPMLGGVPDRPVRPEPRRVLVARTINPFKDRPDLHYGARPEDLADLVAGLEDMGLEVEVAPHPSQNGGKVTPLDSYVQADLVLADPGSPAIIATALGRPVVKTPGTSPAPGTFEAWLSRWWIDGPVRESPWRAPRVSAVARAQAGWTGGYNIIELWAQGLLPGLDNFARMKGL